MKRVLRKWLAKWLFDFQATKIVHQPEVDGAFGRGWIAGDGWYFSFDFRGEQKQVTANIEIGPTENKPPRFHSVDLKDIPALKKYAHGQLRSTGRPWVLVSIGKDPAYFVSFEYDYETIRKVERTYDKSFNVVEAPKPKAITNA